MRIGFDIDGVLADFTSAYQRLIVTITGKDLFLPGDAEDPPIWDWDLFRGYTKEERRATWKAIVADPTFWFELLPLTNITGLQRLSAYDHEVYFLTNRAGIRPKRQTEDWISRHLGFLYPTVLITSDQTGSDKGHIVNALKLEAYIDDKIENARSVAAISPSTRVYLLNKRYNQVLDPNPLYRRVSSLPDFLHTEGLLS